MASPKADAPAADVMPAQSAALLVSEITGADATTDTASVWGVGATDLGIMWDDGQGGVLAAFGDTFVEPGAEGAGTGEWRSNVLLRSTDTSLADGMAFDWALADDSGRAREILGSAKIPGFEHTVIPTAAIAVDGRQYLAHMSVKEWGEPGEWHTNFSRIAFSDDGGHTWSTDGGPEWVNTPDWEDPFQMLSFAADAGIVYVFGTPNGRGGPASVARVPGEHLLDQDQYEYWDGTGWTRSYAAARPVIPGPVAELSVRREPVTGLWQAVHLDGHADLVLRIASAPTGPWGPAQVIATQQDYPGLYGGFIHPWSPQDELYLAMSVWNQYNVAMVRVAIDGEGRVVRPNLVVNPSFEWPGGLDPSTGWTVRGSGSVEAVPAAAKVGRQHVLLGGAPGDHALSQAMAVDPESHYRLSAWTRSSSNLPVDAHIRVRGVGESTFIAGEPLHPGAAWARTQLDFSSGSHSVVVVEIAASTPDGSPDGTLHVDDVGLWATSG